MSDRTQGSVRTGARPGDTATGSTAASDEAPPVTATQSNPGTGAQRAQAAPAAEAPPVTATQSNPGTGAQRAQAAPAAEAPPVTATQSIPGTGAQRAQAAPAADGTAPGSGGTVSISKGPAPRSASADGATPATGATPAAGAEGADTGAQAKVAGSGRQKAARGPRRARLQLRHIDTWSALKISLVLSIAMFFIWMVAVGILYGVLSGLGVFETLNDLFGQLGTATGGDGSTEVITPGIVFGGAAVIGAINIVLMTALCTVAAFIYNMCSDLVGGLEVTLSERD